MPKPIKYVEKAASIAANAAWHVFDTLNQISQNPGFTPKWSDKPLLKSLREDEAEAGLAAHDRFALPASAFRKSASRSWTARRTSAFW